jgi:DNA-binding Lrp family transcriptional regulator
MEKKDTQVDELDMSILRLLRDNARLSYRNIGKTLNMSTGTISQRIRRLVDTGVIKRFTTIIDQPSIGRNCTLLVMIRTRPGSKMDEVVSSIEALDESCCIHTITGDYTLHLMLRLVDHDEASDFLESLRNLEGVQFLTSYVVLRSYKPFYETSI